MISPILPACLTMPREIHTDGGLIITPGLSSRVVNQGRCFILTVKGVNSRGSKVEVKEAMLRNCD